MPEKVIHPFEPVFDENARILILGSFPSVRSRQDGFYYGHPQNRFWPLMAILLRDEKPITNEEKRAFLLKHRLALWDVYQSCTIHGSADSSIRNACPNDIPALLGKTGIHKVCLNGKQATHAFLKAYPALESMAISLPSTSPANAAFTMEKLLACWSCITDDVPR